MPAARTAAVALAIAGLVAAAPALATPLPGRELPAGPALTVYWGGHVFFSRAAFRQWLVEHHVGYDHWAARHPVAKQALRSGRPDVWFAPWQFAPKVALSAAPSSPGTNGILLLLTLGGLALVAVSAMPVRRQQIVGAHVLARVGDRRLSVSVCGFGLLLGAVVAKLAL